MMGTKMKILSREHHSKEAINRILSLLILETSKVPNK
jgi:hypothetical protein